MIKRLNFNLLNGILQAVESDKTYCIFQIGENFNATVNSDHLISGNLYECLEICNKHVHECFNRKKLDISEVLSGCSYKKIDTIIFEDHTGEMASAMPRRFRSIAEIKDYIQKKSEYAIVYIYDLREYYLDDGVWYYLKCAIRKTS